MYELFSTFFSLAAWSFWGLESRIAKGQSDRCLRIQGSEFLADDEIKTNALLWKLNFAPQEVLRQRFLLVTAKVLLFSVGRLHRRKNGNQNWSLLSWELLIFCLDSGTFFCVGLETNFFYSSSYLVAPSWFSAMQFWNVRLKKTFVQQCSKHRFFFLCCTLTTNQY